MLPLWTLITIPQIQTIPQFLNCQHLPELEVYTRSGFWRLYSWNEKAWIHKCLKCPPKFTLGESGLKYRDVLVPPGTSFISRRKLATLPKPHYYLGPSLCHEGKLSNSKMMDKLHCLADIAFFFFNWNWKEKKILPLILGIRVTF